MNRVLIDTSIWIEYFAGNSIVSTLSDLIDQDRIVINNLILCELLPFIILKKEKELEDILRTIDLVPLDIRWNEIINYQVSNLKNGINKVGIPDLIIMDNCILNNLTLFTLDKHFTLMNKLYKFDLFLL